MNKHTQEKEQEFENTLFYHFKNSVQKSIVCLVDKDVEQVFDYMFQQHYREGTDIDSSELTRRFQCLEDQQEANLVLHMFDHSNPEQKEVPPLIGFGQSS